MKPSFLLLLSTLTLTPTPTPSYAQKTQLPWIKAGTEGNANYETSAYIRPNETRVWWIVYISPSGTRTTVSSDKYPNGYFCRKSGDPSYAIITVSPNATVNLIPYQGSDGSSYWYYRRVGVTARGPAYKAGDFYVYKISN